MSRRLRNEIAKKLEGVDRTKYTASFCNTYTGEPITTCKWINDYISKYEPDPNKVYGEWFDDFNLINHINRAKKEIGDGKDSEIFDFMVAIAIRYEKDEKISDALYEEYRAINDIVLEEVDRLTNIETKDKPLEQNQEAVDVLNQLYKQSTLLREISDKADALFNFDDIKLK